MSYQLENDKYQINYKGQDYDVWEVLIQFEDDGNILTVKIATEDLLNAVNPHGDFETDFDSWMDDTIFYYANSEKELSVGEYYGDGWRIISPDMVD